MSKKTQTNQKHMNQNGRVVIEKGLDVGRSMSTIAAELGKDPTTISKEIKKHRIFQKHDKHDSYNEKPNRCALAKDCHRKNLCGVHAPICKKECRNCPQCHDGTKGSQDAPSGVQKGDQHPRRWPDPSG